MPTAGKRTDRHGLKLNPNQGFILGKIRDIIWTEEVYDMPNIKPVSDLKNYNEVLKDIAVGAPVYLTKNGRGRYVLTDIREYEKQQAALQLLAELAEGERSVQEEGWLSAEEVRTRHGL